MTNSLKELIAVLVEKARILESVRERLAEGQRCIIEARPDRLAEETGEAGESFLRLNSLNKRFTTLLPRVAKEMGLPEKTSLSALISAVNPESGIQLRELQDRCFSIAGAIATILSMNEVLIKNSLDIIGRSLALFCNLLGTPETYGAAGRMSNNDKMAASIICREI